MAHTDTPTTWSHKHTSSAGAASGQRREGSSAAAAATAAIQRERSCGCLCMGRLMRRLKKQGKVLCMATRPAGASAAAFDFHYDPLSYSRNFDRSSLDDDGGEESPRVLVYTFSSRFAAAAAKGPLAQGNITR